MQQHIIIIGSGFAGFNAAKYLTRKAKITLIDKNNYHLFQPFLYQVATSELSHSDVAFNLRTQFKEYKNISIIMDTVIKIELQKKLIQTLQGLTLSYDYLIIATGSEVNYFGNEEWQNYTLSLKNLSDALKIRQAWIALLEKRELEFRLNKKNFSQINCIIIGGGPTGVEVAGSMLEFIKYSLKEKFTNIKKSHINLFIIEAGPRLLPSFSENASSYSEKELLKLGAIIKLNTKVNAIKAGEVSLSTGQTLRAEIIIWAAGVQASNIKNAFVEHIKVEKNGKIQVKRDLSLPTYPEVFVVGDISEVSDYTGKSLPGLAAVATQQGKFVAKVISKKLGGNNKNFCFSYRNLGNLAIIGRYNGIAEFHLHKFYGLIGWAIWSLAHIYFLVELRSRIVVFIKWLWIYYTKASNEDIIIKQDDDL